MKKFLNIILSLILLLSCASYVKAVQNNSNINTSQVSQISLIKPYKNINHKVWVIKRMNSDAKSLSEADKSVITKYVYGAVRGEDTFLLINCYLRGNLSSYIPAKEITTPLKHRLKYYSDCLSKSVSKTKLPQNMILYRGVDEKAIKTLFSEKGINNVVSKPVSDENLNILKQKLVGTKFTEKGFMSTSYDKNCAKKTKFMYEVYAPKGLQAILIESFGKKEEKEVLINKNTKWEVKNITKDIDKKSNREFYIITIRYVIK